MRSLLHGSGVCGWTSADARTVVAKGSCSVHVSTCLMVSQHLHGTFCMVNQTRLKMMLAKDRRAQQLLWMTNVLAELGRLVGLRNL